MVSRLKMRDRVPFSYGNFDFSLRGRKYLAYAHWSKKNAQTYRKNVVTFFLNRIFTETLHYMNVFRHKEDCEFLNGDEMEKVFTIIFTSIDFHEFLHLFIRREVDYPNKHIVDKNTEDFICRSTQHLSQILEEDNGYMVV